MANTLLTRSVGSLAGISQLDQPSTSYARPHSLPVPASAAERLHKRQCVRTLVAAAAQPATQKRTGDTLAGPQEFQCSVQQGAAGLAWVQAHCT